MKLEQMESLVNEAVGDADLRPEEIPAIDLYLDQIISLVTDKRREGSAHYQNRELTKTMINNYSKDGLISPIKGKKYSKEHIIQMLLVYDLKNTLSIGEIKRILQNVYSLEAFREEGLEPVYRRYLATKAFERENAFSLLDVYIQRAALDSEDDEDFLTLLLGLASMSSYLKSTVQVLLEARYPDLDEEKTREEQAKKEEAKRQKAEKKAEAAQEKAELKKAEKEKKEKSAQEKPKKEKPAQEKPKKEKPSQEKPKKEKSSQEKPKKEKSSQEKPVQKKAAPAEDAEEETE